MYFIMIIIRCTSYSRFDLVDYAIGKIRLPGVSYYQNNDSN